jgi:hypothetical protein
VVNNNDITPDVELAPEPVIEYEDEKVEMLIKEVIRIRPQDFSACKHSFEEWVNSWDK